MKYFSMFLFLCFFFSTHAQKQYKNEIAIGYFTGSVFFDTTGFKSSIFLKGRDVNLSYTRSLTSNLSLGGSYSRSDFSYNWYPSHPQNDSLENNTLIFRGFKVVSLFVGYQISKWGFSVRVKSGGIYRFNAQKHDHLRYLRPANTIWSEPIGVFIGINSFGISLGASLSHPILWRFFGELDCNYSRMFTGYNTDRNQLLLVYRLGFRF